MEKRSIEREIERERGVWGEEKHCVRWAVVVRDLSAHLLLPQQRAEGQGGGEDGHTAGRARSCEELGTSCRALARPAHTQTHAQQTDRQTDTAHRHRHSTHTHVDCERYACEELGTPAEIAYAHTDTDRCKLPHTLSLCLSRDSVFLSVCLTLSVCLPCHGSLSDDGRVQN